MPTQSWEFYLLRLGWKLCIYEAYEVHKGGGGDRAIIEA